MDLRPLLQKLFPLLVVVLGVGPCTTPALAQWSYGVGGSGMGWGYLEEYFGGNYSVFGWRTDESDWGVMSYNAGTMMFTFDAYSESTTWFLMNFGGGPGDLDGDGWGPEEEYYAGTDPTAALSNPWWEPDEALYTNPMCSEIWALLSEYDEPLPMETMAEWTDRVLGSSIVSEIFSYDPASVWSENPSKLQFTAGFRRAWRISRDFFSHAVASGPYLFIYAYQEPVEGLEAPPEPGEGTYVSMILYLGSSETALALACACGATEGCPEPETYGCETDCPGWTYFASLVDAYANIWSPSEDGDFGILYEYEIGGTMYYQDFDFKPETGSALDNLRVIFRSLVVVFFALLLGSSVVRTFRQW